MPDNYGVYIGVSVHMLLPAYQAWVNFAPVCPFRDNDAAGMQGLETNSSTGMWHHPASASLSSALLSPLCLGSWAQDTQSIQQQRKIQMPAAPAASSHPCALPKHAYTSFFTCFNKTAQESCEPEKENWSSL